MTLVISNETRSYRISRRFLEKGTKKILSALRLQTALLGITFVGNRRIALLNRRYLKKKGPTDVISFPMGERELLGDIVISLPMAGRQAKVFGRSLRMECLVLIIHGLLHLLGYDHILKADYRKMAEKEKELLRIAS